MRILKPTDLVVYRPTASGAKEYVMDESLEHVLTFESEEAAKELLTMSDEQIKAMEISFMTVESYKSFLIDLGGQDEQSKH